VPALVLRMTRVELARPAAISTAMIYVQHMPRTDAAARLSALLRTEDELSARELTARG
jgi:hypothetical protein